jgi:hypothetical protein
LQAGWSFEVSDGGGLLYNYYDASFPSQCDANNKFNFHNLNAGSTSTGTTKATLSGSGCGTIVVKQCYSASSTPVYAKVEVYINNALLGATTTPAGPGTASGDLTVDFTFVDSDVLKIVEVANSVAEIKSLVFHPNNECLAAAVNNYAAGVGADDTAKKADRLARMTSVSPSRTHRTTIDH